MTTYDDTRNEDASAVLPGTPDSDTRRSDRPDGKLPTRGTRPRVWRLLGSRSPKRAVVAMVVVAALSVGAFTAVTATDAVTHHEKAASADAWSTLECASGLIGWGVTIVGGIFSDGASVGVEAWLGAGTGYAAFADVAANQRCVSQSYYNHIGARELCYANYFEFWQDNGTAVFKPGIQACLKDPYTDDAVLCVYIHPAGWENACAQQDAYNAVMAAEHVGQAITWPL